MNKKVRIGIDVGGTFTDAVIIDNADYKVLAKMKIPTTHEEGVAVGVVKIISTLMKENQIEPEDVMFIAHGTTQATNALLEGDVAQVGIIGMGTGVDARSAKSETNIGNIELAPGKYLNSSNAFIDSVSVNDEMIEAAICELLDKKAQVIVASEAYSVDDPENELKVMACAAKKGLYTTGGHEISQLYGLKMRTRTAVVNASLIPKMIETANMTEQAVLDTKIKSGLMIMRCDGGVMSINEVRKRPILTMLSGLAAGVAGALMYEKISDGIFFEVGGTSVDISVIKNGKVMIKYAQVGGHKTYLQSLDVRTLGVAGGSMIRIKDKKMIDIGPRSAHIAGKNYECFTPEDAITEASVQFVSPRADDPCEYATIVAQDGKEYSLTLAGAANLLGYVPKDDYAYGNIGCTKVAWSALGDYLSISAKDAAKQAMDIAIKKLAVVINDLINEYELDRKFITLVGGGGSGAVIVNALAGHFNFKWRIAQNAPYISTIGVALAMVREQLERTIVNPTDEDIKKIRADIIERIVKSGANEETVDVSIEIDAQKNILRAVATGATELRKKDLNANQLGTEQLKSISAEALVVDKEQVQPICNTGRWYLFEAKTSKRILFGLVKLKGKSCCVIDREGVVRLKKEKAEYIKFKKSEQKQLFNTFLDDNTTYSDANATIPKVFLFYKEKMLDLTGMQTAEQLYSIMDVETEIMSADEEIIAVAYK
ncbi:hydantoinase/oxoprolinase family protein [Cellulosilyticum sp. I15G10I2]|uniref:hydantoinase/oxoprolinase family protein n=1 Tax=Cellulosilyticum sp. I15G10I2 TaxID=1892843 RepID=UPI00085BD9F1|nr:hydantoinase/oxoprolinase family protein [Cellulosilyticum sp. I15G10I2]